MSLITSKEPAAPVTNISHCSVHDGQGVRTVVYLKGCAMRCRWCHNPETLSGKPEILYIASKCIGCGRCAQVCPGCHTAADGKHIFLRAKCTACGKCADACPKLALTLCGREMTVEEVAAHLLRNPLTDGITFSGGEPFQQAEDCLKLAKIARANGLNVWSYTGYTYEHIMAHGTPAQKEFLKELDVLVDGPFVLAQRTLSLSWRGSKNQRLIDVPASLVTGEVVIKSE